MRVWNRTAADTRSADACVAAARISDGGYMIGTRPCQPATVGGSAYIWNFFAAALVFLVRRSCARGLTIRRNYVL